MKKIGIFYGSTTGTTEKIANKIAEILNIDDKDVHDVASSSPSSLAPYDLIVVGTSTWGNGDLQEDWYDFVDGVRALDLKGKTIALFGCGDETMTESFCSAVGKLYRDFKETGAEFVGAYDTDGYNFNHSDAVVDGKAVGLLLDEVNHPELTDFRLRGWIGEIM
ncbi:MAG: flavodoxin [Muribaculaceae bacterium]|nr:flavodoxin [Muribaculaceae bacterium]